MRKAYFNWSSGKDSALALYYAMQSNYHVSALFSVIKKETAKIAMHEISLALLKRQAEAIGIPLITLAFDTLQPTAAYTSAMQRQMDYFKQQDIHAAIFGDLYLEQLKKNREHNCNAAGMSAVFPLWKIPQEQIMSEFLHLGFKAIVTCIDNAVLDKSFVGRIIDETFLNDLPSNVDICGENGEYHSFVFDGPIFKHPVQFKLVNKYYTDYSNADGTPPNRFWYAELK